jgi:hypothetical protein
MANTKKEWRNLSAAEKAIQIFINAAPILIAIIATLYMYVFQQDCSGIDKPYLWCATHPGSSVDVLGMILFWFGCFWLSGVWGYFITDDDANYLKPLQFIAWVCALVGPALIIIF